MKQSIAPRESWVPYPVSDEIDDETGFPIQPQWNTQQEIKEKSLKQLVLAILWIDK